MTVPIINIEVPLDKVQDLEPSDKPTVFGFLGKAEVYLMVNGDLQAAFRLGADNGYGEPEWHNLTMGLDR